MKPSSYNRTALQSFRAERVVPQHVSPTPSRGAVKNNPRTHALRVLYRVGEHARHERKTTDPSRSVKQSSPSATVRLPAQASTPRVEGQQIHVSGAARGAHSLEHDHHRAPTAQHGAATASARPSRQNRGFRRSSSSCARQTKQTRWLGRPREQRDGARAAWKARAGASVHRVRCAGGRADPLLCAARATCVARGQFGLPPCT
eukprot:7115826-Prymnesium_polylepis.1